MTNKYKHLSRLFLAISIIITFFPIGFYTVYAFIAGTAGQKFVMGGLFTTAIIMVGLNALMKLSLRSPIWLLLIGVYSAISSIMPLLLMIAFGTILDEILITPLHKKYKNLYTINAQIDKRL